VLFPQHEGQAKFAQRKSKFGLKDPKMRQIPKQEGVVDAELDG